ncbi:Zinc finger protein chinmo, partial [Gryllus bimaculatus]
MEMNSRIRSLTWNNHDNMVKKQLEMFMKSSVLADCTLSAEGQHLKTHKIILAACSHYFETLFRQDNMNNFVIVLKDVKLCNLKALLHFMYCGEVVVSQDHLKDFIDTAKSLQVRGLEDEYKKFDLRRTPKKSRLDIISTTHDITSMVQMKTNYSDLSDIDETTLTVGISRLSVNSDNYSPFHIQNTTIPIHSFPTLTTFDLNNIKFSQICVPEIKSEVQCESRIQKPVNKNMVQSPTSDLLEKITMLDNNIEITKEIPKDLKIQQTTLSSEPETCEKQHHKSVKTQERNTSKPNTRKHKKARDVPIERKLLDLTTSVNANNNKNDDNKSNPNYLQTL